MEKKSLIPGRIFTDRRLICSDDILKFAQLSGDFNPLHLDDKTAEKGRFKRRVAHGIYVASFFSKILGNKEYGLNGIYLSQTLNFLNPVFINDIVDIAVEIIKIQRLKSVITLRTTCSVMA